MHWKSVFDILEQEKRNQTKQDFSIRRNKQRAKTQAIYNNDRKLKVYAANKLQQCIMFRYGESRKGHMVDAWALVGDERRGKLR